MPGKKNKGANILHRNRSKHTHKPVTKKVHKKRVTKSHKRHIGAMSNMTAVQHKAAARSLLEQRLGIEYVRRDNARLVRDKRKYSKVIADLKRQIKALK